MISSPTRYSPVRLNQKMRTLKQAYHWDGVVVPSIATSKILDPFHPLLTTVLYNRNRDGISAPAVRSGGGGRRVMRYLQSLLLLLGP